jgi:hypothetical protein
MSQFSNKLRDYARVLSALNTVLLEEILQNVTRRIEVDLIKTFHNESNPDGKKWKKRKNEYDHPINYAGGALDSSRKVEVLKNAIRISYDTDYSKYVNNIRQLVPDDVPEDWLVIVEQELQKSLDKRFK